MDAGSVHLTKDDLDACLDVVESYWSQINEYLARAQKQAAKLSNDDLETLFHYFEQLVEIVALDLANEAGRPRLLQRLQQKEIFDKYFTWLLEQSDSSCFNRLREHLFAAVLPLCRPVSLLSTVLPDRHLCQFFISSLDYAISITKQQQRSPAHAKGQPTHSQDVGNLNLGHIVLAVSKAIADDQDLFLALFSNRFELLPSYRKFVERNPKDENTTKFPIITAMLAIAFNSGESGDLAREAIVLLVDAVRQQNRSDIGIFLAESTDLCPVLATGKVFPLSFLDCRFEFSMSILGLSGLFSTLPRKLLPDTHSVLFKPREFDSFFNRSEPILFVECFRFVNRVVSVAHPAIRDRLVDFVYHGFLVPVLAPALNQPIGDELITTIVYLDYLCLQNVSDNHVAMAFVKFLQQGQYDGMATVDTLIKYLDMPSSIRSSQASLSCQWRLLYTAIAMFHSYLSLRSSEASGDVFYELVHRHLNSLTYLMRAQRQQLINSTKLRLKNFCVLCSVKPKQPTLNGNSPEEQLPNVFYKRGADHLLSLVTFDASRNEAGDVDVDGVDLQTRVVSTPTKKHLYSIAVIRSLEHSAVGRQLLSEYTALLEEAPRRLSLVERQTRQWERCGTWNSILTGLCPVHRQLVIDNRGDDFFANDIWDDLVEDEENNDDADLMTLIGEAEDEIDNLLDHLKDDNDSSGLDSVDEMFEQFEQSSELGEKIPTAKTELPFSYSNQSSKKDNHVDNDNQFVNSSKISLGPFLTRLFELADHFPELPIPVIAALSSLLSYLASIPHALLAPLLIDPHLNVHPNVKSLPLVLASVRERFLEKITSDG